MGFRPICLSGMPSDCKTNKGITVQAIVRIENVENYSKITADIACEESKLLVFLDKADPKRFRKEILSLEIHCFLNKLNLDSSEEVVLSFIKYFNPDFSLTWLKRSNSFETANRK